MKKIKNILLMIFIFSLSFIVFGYSKEDKTIKADELKYMFSISNSEELTVSGGGEFKPNALVACNCVVPSGYLFDGWYDGNIKVSSSPNHIFKMPYKNYVLTPKATKEVKTNNKNVTINVNNINYGCIITSETEDEDFQVVNALPFDGYDFIGWYIGSLLISKDPIMSIDTTHNDGGSFQVVYNYVATFVKHCEFYYDIPHTTYEIIGDFIYGEEIEIVIKADEGYKIDNAVYKMGKQYLYYDTDSTSKMVITDNIYMYGMSSKIVPPLKESTKRAVITIGFGEEVSFGTQYGYAVRVNYCDELNVAHLEAYPYKGYAFFGWQYEDQIFSDNQFYDINCVDEVTSVKALFKRPSESIFVEYIYGSYVRDEILAEKPDNWSSFSGEGFHEVGTFIDIYPLPRDIVLAYNYTKFAFFSGRVNPKDAVSLPELDDQEEKIWINEIGIGYFTYTIVPSAVYS